MKKNVESCGNPILDRVLLIHKDFITSKDIEEAPINPAEFYSWWWDTKASNCLNCILGEHRTCVVKPDGLIDGKPKIMIIGEGPGILEDVTGLPMVSPTVLRSSRCGFCRKASNCFSHKMLDRPNSRHPRNKTISCNPLPSENLQLTRKFYLQSAGSLVDGLIFRQWGLAYPRQSWLDLYNKLHPDKPFTHSSPWFITNTTLCRSSDPITGKDSPPSTAVKAACKKWLAWQWAAVNPRISIVLGIPALDVVTSGSEKSGVIPGEIFNTSKFGPIIFFNHPAKAMREENKMTQGLMIARIASIFKKALEFSGYPTEF